MARGTIAAEAPRWRFPTRSFFLKLGLGTIITGLLVAAAILFTGILSPGKNTGSVTVALPTVTPTVAAKPATPAVTPTPTRIPQEKLEEPSPEMVAETIGDDGLFHQLSALVQPLYEKNEDGTALVPRPEFQLIYSGGGLEASTVLQGTIVEISGAGSPQWLILENEGEQLGFFVYERAKIGFLSNNGRVQIQFDDLEVGDKLNYIALFVRDGRAEARAINVIP